MILCNCNGVNQVDYADAYIVYLLKAELDPMQEAILDSVGIGCETCRPKIAEMNKDIEEVVKNVEGKLYNGNE